MDDEFFIPDLDLDPEVGTDLEVLSPEGATSGDWSPQLVLDLALGLHPLDQILARHNVPWSRWEVLSNHGQFTRAVARQAQELASEGLTFRAKARAQAEDYLREVDLMVTNANVDPKVRLDAIKSMVKWGDLEPRPDTASQTPGAQVNIQINI